MKLQDLERAESLIKLNNFLGDPLKEMFERNGVSLELYAVVQQLLNDGQFYSLLHLKRAEHHFLCVLEHLDKDTEYLRQELEQQLQCLHVLLNKIEREEHLRRDRDVLLSSVDESSEEGISSCFSGKTTP